MPRASRSRSPTVAGPLPYLTGRLRPAFDAWLEGAVTRVAPPLEFREVRKGVQALSTLYVEGRAGADLGARALKGRAKRAALTSYYAPLHFLVTHHALIELGPERLDTPRRVVDLGAGSGAVGAAVATALPELPTLFSIDRSGYLLAEARRTHAAFGLAGRTRRGRLPHALPRAARGDLLVLGWFVNELDDAERETLLDALVARLAAGTRLLLVEPIATAVTPWWDTWRHTLGPHGIEERLGKWRVALPEWLGRLDRASGLDHRELSARLLAGPLDRAVPRAPGPHA